ncbi:MAG: bifunctional 5,10-methylenetetrahydrofolate dehydrogenase/5,10-methenyltetrahydrofolate cyclohydrolase, partial [Solirubrobacterales bacterium]
MNPGARILDGKAIAEAVRSDVAAEVGELSAAIGRAPALATVLVGDDPASEVYVSNKHRACEEVGIESVHRAVPGTAGQSELEDIVAELNGDDGVDGILVQLPLPEGLDAGPVIGSIDPAKDVDGLTAENQGRLASGSPWLVPCTPAGVIEILDRSDIPIEGREVVLIGRSNLVGRPLI